VPAPSSVGADVVHFDGHGSFGEVAAQSDPTSPGALISETTDGSSHPVAGIDLGTVAVRSGVRALILNACQSAHATVPGSPLVVSDTAGERSRLRYSSLANEIFEHGVPGVVAMRRKAFAPMVTSFVEALYGGLATGRTLGEGVSVARRHLQMRQMRCGRCAADAVPRTTTLTSHRNTLSCVDGAVTRREL